MNDVSMNSFVVLSQRHGGATRLSIFFALWTLALVLLNDARVNAAPIYEASSTPSGLAWWMAPAPAPALGADSMWNALSEHSEVISGRWHGAGDVPVVKKPIASNRNPEPTNEATKAPKRIVVTAVEDRPVVADVAIRKSSSLSVVEVQIARQIAARDFTGALDALERAHRDNPGSASRLRLLEAHIAVGRGDPERAYSILLESLPDVRVAPQQHDLLAAVMLRTSRYAEAAAIYRALLTVDPANARWWAGYAVTQEKLDHRTELMPAYRTVRSLAPPGSALATWASARLERIS